MPKPAQIVWIVECKWHHQGRGWEVSLDHFPFRTEEGALAASIAAQERNVGWQYRAIRFTRATA